MEETPLVHSGPALPNTLHFSAFNSYLIFVIINHVFFSLLDYKPLKAKVVSSLHNMLTVIEKAFHLLPPTTDFSALITYVLPHSFASTSLLIPLTCFLQLGLFVASLTFQA